VKSKFLVLSIVSTLALTGCSQGEFAEANSSKRTYQIQIDDSNTADTQDSTVLGQTSSQNSNPAIKGQNPDGDPDDTDDNDDPTNETPKGGDNTPGGADKEGVADCAKLTGLDASRIKVAGSTQNIKLSSQQGLSMKVTGNKNVVTLDLASQPVDTVVKAICIFIAGNQNTIELDIGVHVQTLAIIARGNRPSIQVSTTEGSIIDSIKFDAKGNGGKLTVDGEGTFPCDKANPGIVCQ